MRSLEEVTAMILRWALGAVMVGAASMALAGCGDDGTGGVAAGYRPYGSNQPASSETAPGVDWGTNAFALRGRDGLRGRHVPAAWLLLLPAVPTAAKLVATCSTLADAAWRDTHASVAGADHDQKVSAGTAQTHYGLCTRGLWRTERTVHVAT